MRRYAPFLVLLAVLAVLSIVGCTPALPTCDPGALQPPDLTSPDWREVMDPGAVTLEWTYPDSSCEPESYEVILSRERDYSVIDITADTGGPANSWSPPSPLDPAEEYFWRVAAKVGATKGSYSQELRSFFTEPLCTPSDLVAPNLTLPVNGGIFERGFSSLEWEWPVTTCVPPSYRVELSPTEDFSDTTLFGGTGDPGTRWGPGSPLDPATQYWWRIYAFADGSLGPASATWTFFTDPVCTGGSLVAPDLDLPADGDTVSTATPEFTWTYPDSSCAPEGYHLQVSSAADMSSLVLDANNPGTAARSFVPGTGLADCGTYYWRVAMVSEGVEGSFSDVHSFSVDTAGSCTCDPSEIARPDLVWPGPYEIVPGTLPTLEWSNPGSCNPEGYAVHLSDIYDFSDTSLYGGTGSPSTTWSPGSALEPATQYWWEVAGMVGSDTGEFSSRRSFFTGPECNYVGTVGTPVRLAPEDGTVLDSLTAVLRYEPGPPGCIPDGYFLNLQTDPAFGGTNLLTEYSLPATTVITDPLTDCTRYYWTVTAVQDSDYGPASDVGWFFTNESGSCSLPGMPGTMKRNAFCRSGTYPEHFPAVHTFEEGDYLEAAARNSFSSYLQVLIPEQDGSMPPHPLGKCWLPREYVNLWGNVESLKVVEPPPPPTATPVPTATPLVCSADLNQEQCKQAGGKWVTPVTHQGDPYCECP